VTSRHQRASWQVEQGETRREHTFGVPPRIARSLCRLRHPWRAAGIALAVFIGGLVIALASVVPFSSETARRQLIDLLADRLDAEVGLADLRLRLLPRFQVEGRGLSIRHKGRRDVPPMISIERFSAEGNIRGLLRRHIARVVLERLDIEIPPDRNRVSGPANSPNPPSGSAYSHTIARTFVVDELVSTDGQVVIIPDDSDKQPKVWPIHRLHMSSVSVDGQMPFVATLENAVPPGHIETSGLLGPWRSEEPGRTPVDGKFAFGRADLGVFKGISGVLSARGTFGGTLHRLDIHGDTETPDFTVAAGGHPMPLHATYHAIVDGTNGNTILDEVHASFLQTSLVAKGSVAGTAGIAGRTVTLDVVMNRGRLEDVLRMVVKAGQPPMTGALKIRTTFVLPPGDRDVAQKLQLAGTFAISGTRFTSPDLQAKVNELSHRTRGQRPNDKAVPVSSGFTGTFSLKNSQLTIPEGTYDVPGSTIRLSGNYGLLSEEVDFAGTAYTDAKISEMATGFKRLLLKPVDFILRKSGGGSAIPIRITGTRTEPRLGLDKSRVFKR